MSHILGRKWNRLSTTIQPNILTVFFTPKPAFYCSDGLHPCITPESNPANHTISDLGLFYKIDNAMTLGCLFKYGKLHQKFIEECKTFDGTYIMIRKPALEIIHCLKQTNFDYPVNKYVLFGKRGYGATITMSHVVHYAHMSDYLIVHFPTILNWVTKYTERPKSTAKPGFIDIPALASPWLTHFKNQNLNVIKKFDLRLQNDYTWNVQEENKKGESILNLVDHGISRAKYSCEVIMGLLEEVKLLSKSGKVKTLVAIENFSILFQPGRKSSNKKFTFLEPQMLSIADSIKNLAKADWHNGAVILSCHNERIIEDDTNHLPLNKLSLKGFEFLDPFIPIEVPGLTDLEMTNLLEFYRHKKWLLTSREGDLELKILSGGNMRTLQELCGPL